MTSLTVDMTVGANASRRLSPSFHVSQDARRHEPAELTERFRRQRVEVDPTDCPLLELDRRPRADQPRRQLADVRLVPDQRDACLARMPGDLLHHRGWRPGWRQGVTMDDGRLAFKVPGEDLGGLT